MFDVHVAGSGPGGAVCARECARFGLTVLVSEEHARVGLPVQCSGLVSKEGLDGMGVDYRKVALNEVTGANIYAPSGDCLHVGTSEVRAVVVDRAGLDQMLAEQAEREGARVETGKKVTRATVRGRVVVGADGYASTIAKDYGFPPIREFAVCAQADFEGVRLEDKRTIDVYLSNERYPGFFAWMIPTGSDTAHVGLGVFYEAGGRMPPVKEHFARLLREERISSLLDGAKEISRLAGIIPLGVRAETVRGNALLVGDAAGHAKATTGGGIVFATVAGGIAAEAIAAHFEENAPLSNYERMWRAELQRDLELHMMMRRMYNSLSDAEIDRYAAMARALGAERFLNAHGHMDRPSRMMSALSSGAFAPLRAFALSVLSDYGNILARAP